KFFIFPVLFLLILLLRFFLFPRILPPEPEIERMWAKSIPAPEAAGYGVANMDDEPPMHFRLGDIIGYFRRDGSFLQTENVLFSAAIDDNFYCNFGKISREILIMDYLGRIYSRLTASGYPMIREGRFFTIATNRGGISEYNENGEILWSRKFNGTITDIDVTENMIAVGVSSGEVYVLGDEGTILSTVSETPGRIAVVYGCTLSEQTGQAAVLSGIDPQTLGLYNLDKDTPLPEAEHLTGTDFRRRTFITFVKEGEEIVYESGDGIAFFNPSRGTARETVIKGRIRGFSEDTGSNLSGAVFSNDSENSGSFSLMSPERYLFMSGKMPDAELYIRMEDGLIFLGSGKTIAAFLLSLG
ncbi:MAG: hypothetical protein ACLFST_12550, partial [Spirochaetia bacterium]